MQLAEKGLGLYWRINVVLQLAPIMKYIQSGPKYASILEETDQTLGASFISLECNIYEI